MTTNLDVSFVREVREGLRRYDFLDTRTTVAEMIGASQLALGLRGLEPGRRRGFDDLPPADLYLGCADRDDDLGRLCRIHWLTEVCVRVVQVDGEDFVLVDDWLDVPIDAQGLLRAASLPHVPDAPDRGVLRTMLPMFRLLMELIDVAYERDDIEAVLKYLHLIAEYAALLAWERVVASPGEPDVIATRLSWAPTWQDAGRTRKCPRSDAAGSVARTAPVALTGPREWNKYLNQSLSRVSLLLGSCGASHQGLGGARLCAEPCAVAPAGHGSEDLAWRLHSVHRFATSAVISLRHPSPLGHGFRLPDKQELDDAWDTTVTRLMQAQHYQRHAPTEPDSWGALHGLASLVTYWAGAEQMQEATTLLADLRQTALDLLPD